MSNNSKDHGPGGNSPSKNKMTNYPDYPGGNWPSGKKGKPSGGGRNPGPKNK